MTLVRDAMALCGLGMLLYGATLVHPSLGWITGGAGAIGLAVAWGMRARK